VKRRTKTFGHRDSTPASPGKTPRGGWFGWNINAYEGIIALVLNEEPGERRTEPEIATAPLA
jgi:hypothetical protein